MNMVGTVPEGQDYELYVSRHATAREYLTVLLQWLID